MENATKALIIAGAVLIAILLISVGIMVFNASSDPINQAQNSSEQQAVQMFNEAFMANLGEDRTGQQIKSLISTAIASNSKNDDHQVNIVYGSRSIEGNNLGVSNISTKSKYNTEEAYDRGYIRTITITDAT